MANTLNSSINIENYLSGTLTLESSRETVGQHLRKILNNEISGENASHFFSDESIILLRSKNGIVETPKSLAAYMVKLAYSRWKFNNLDVKVRCDALHWFDPCGGAGIFPIEILKFYIEELNIRDPIKLPKITISEISELGLAVSLANIIELLKHHEILISDYINNDKLKLNLGDTLEMFHGRGDLFLQEDKFDITIGNPPYVRASRLSSSYKKKLKQNFRGLYSGNADLYTYFLAAGISNLNKNGVLAYISPAAFIRAKSCMRLRIWLEENTTLDSFIDLDETKVFEDAELHTAVYIFKKKNGPSMSVQYLHIKTEQELDTLVNKGLDFSEAMMDKPLSGAGWAFHPSQASLDEYSKTFSACIKMKDLGIEIYSGIRTGCSAAFVLNADQQSKFAPNVRVKWLKQLILPSNIKKWTGYKNINYMIVIPSGSISVDKEIIDFLDPHKDTLIKRAEIKNSNQWYALRACNYYDQMERQKIAFPDLSGHQRFSLVGADVYIPDGAYFIDSDNLVLLGILNSDLAKQYFVHRCSSVGNLKSKGRFRFKKEFVKDFPLPRLCLSDGVLQKKISEVVSNIIKNGETVELSNKLNELVEKLYRDNYDQ
jgi:hypothetical protein